MSCKHPYSAAGFRRSLSIVRGFPGSGVRRAMPLFAMGIFLAGCASVEVTKITARNRDTEKGFRYYLPRPYIAVKQPMPVQGEDIFLYGVIQEGHIVEINADKLSGRQKAAFVGLHAPGRIAIPEAFVASVDPSLRDSESRYVQHANAVNGAGKPTPETPADPTAADPTTNDDKPKEESKSSAHGTFGGNVATKLHDEINSYYDIVYMQDFEEQYAIRYHAGLGYASGHVNLTNGWVMDGADIKIDNTVLGKFIFNNVDKLIDLGVTAAKSYLSPGSAVAGATGKGLTPTQQAAVARAGATTLDKLSLPKGKTVLLRVRLLTIAQPGLYPLLKPGENPTGGTDGPACVPDKDGRLVPSATTYHDFVLLPFRPYTAVAYNVRKTVEIEAVSSTDTPLTVARPTPSPSPGTHSGQAPNDLGPTAKISAADLASLKATITQLSGKPEDDFPLITFYTQPKTLSITLANTVTMVPDERGALAVKLEDAFKASHQKVGPDEIVKVEIDAAAGH